MNYICKQLFFLLKKFKFKIFIECNNVLGLFVENNVEIIKRFILYILKGKYFRNDIVNDLCVDVDMDGLIFYYVVNQWLWKDGKEGWILYLIEMNDRINKFYNCDFNFFVVVIVKD